MAATSSSIKGSVTWQLEKDVTGFSSIKTVSQTKSVSVSSGFDQIYNKRYTIAAAGTQSIDLSSFTNDIGEAVTTAKVLGIALFPTGENSICRVEPHSTNGLTWFFTASASDTPRISIPGGGMLVFAEPVGTVVDGTHKVLLVTNTGSASMTLDVVVFVLD